MNDKQTTTKQISNMPPFLPEKNGLLQLITYHIHTQKKVPAETLASAGNPLSWRPPTLPLSQYHRRKRA